METSQTPTAQPETVLAHWHYTPEEWAQFADYVKNQSKRTANIITLAATAFFLVIYLGIFFGENSVPFKLLVIAILFVLFHLPVLGFWFSAGRSKNLAARDGEPNPVIIRPTSIQWNDKKEEFYFLLDAEIKPAATLPTPAPALLIVRVNRKQSYRRYEIPIPPVNLPEAQELVTRINQPDEL